MVDFVQFSATTTVFAALQLLWMKTRRNHLKLLVIFFYARTVPEVPLFFAETMNALLEYLIAQLFSPSPVISGVECLGINCA